MMEIDVADLLREILGKSWEFCYVDTPEMLFTLANSGPTDLICWKAANYRKLMPQLHGRVRQNRTLCNATHITFAKSRRYEAEILGFGQDDYIVLPVDSEILRVRVLNAIKRKALLRTAREEMWTTFAYRHSILDHALFIFEIDLDTGRAIQMKTSEEAERHFYPLHSFQEDEDTIVHFHPDDRLVILDIFGEGGLRRLLDAGVTEREFNYRMQDRNGMWKWVQTRIRFEKDMFGGQRCFAYTKPLHHKVQEKQIYEKALQESVYTLLVIDPAHDVCRKFVPGKSRVGNTASCSYHSNYRRFLHAFLEGKQYEQACKDFKLETIENALSTQNRFYRHYSGQMPGTDTFRRFSCEFFYVEEKKGTIAILIWDVTDLYQEIQAGQKKLIEKLRQEGNAYLAKSETISRISHDLRTPLNAVIGLTDIAQKENQDAQVAEQLQKIEMASHNLLQTIDDILSIEKMNGGGITIHSEPYMRQQFVRVLDTIVRPMMEQRKIAFTDELACQIPCICIDGARLNQILLNLFSNAAQFTPGGGTVRFRVQQYIKQKGELWLHFTVEDTGIGMSEAFLPHAFEPYAQENTQRRPAQGAGLGLTIAKKLAEKMGGKIQLESVKGKGTTVELDLPIKAAPPEQVPQAAPLPDEALLRGKRILFAEDNQLNMDVVAYLLELKGLKVDFAYDGQQAVQQFTHRPAGTYAAILLDVYMPVMDGLAAAKAIRAAEKESGGHVPILAMTADAFEEEEQRTKQAGMDAHLTKPIRPEVLYQTLLRMLQNR